MSAFEIRLTAIIREKGRKKNETLGPKYGIFCFLRNFEEY